MKILFCGKYQQVGWFSFIPAARTNSSAVKITKLTHNVGAHKVFARATKVAL